MFHGEQALETVSADDKDSYVRIPRTEITFQGEQSTKNVIVDDKGFYQTDLPIGLYKMTARGPQLGPATLTQYIRLFQISSATTIVLNGALHMAQDSCDAVLGQDADQEDWKDICGGEDYFPIPSKYGIPFQLYVRFPQRQRSGPGILYDSEKIGRPDARVFLAYNLFSLEANQVIYSPKNSTIQATGNVVISDIAGVTHTDSEIFKIENGQAVPMHQMGRRDPRTDPQL